MKKIRVLFLSVASLFVSCKDHSQDVGKYMIEVVQEKPGPTVQIKQIINQSVCTFALCDLKDEAGEVQVTVQLQRRHSLGDSIDTVYISLVPNSINLAETTLMFEK